MNDWETRNKTVYLHNYLHEKSQRSALKMLALMRSIYNQCVDCIKQAMRKLTLYNHLWKPQKNKLPKNKSKESCASLYK